MEETLQKCELCFCPRQVGKKDMSKRCRGGSGWWGGDSFLPRDFSFAEVGCDLHSFPQPF